MVNIKPNTTLATTTYIKAHIGPTIAYNKINTPITINKFLNNLKKCHPSVNPTNKVVENGKRGPANGSLFLYLLYQDIFGSQKNLFLKQEKIDEWKWNCKVSITASHHPAIPKQTILAIV